MKVFLLILTTALLVAASAAQASIGRFYDTGKIQQHGHSVNVGGPWAWDGDEDCVVIHVTIVQNGVIARGDSAMIEPPTSSWSASATTSGTLHAGSANARATATLQRDNGSTETYTWTQQITLR